MNLRRRLPIALLGLAAAGAAGLPLIASADPADFDLPNLVSNAPELAYLESYTVDRHGVGFQDRLLLRFDGFIRNEGTGPVDFQGDPTAGTMQQYAKQHVGGALVPYASSAQFTYTANDGHNHWHLMNAAEYSLWDAAGTTQIRAGSKVGFCLYDIDRIGTQGPAMGVYNNPITGNFCRQAQPTATSLREGVSAGWRDEYGPGLAFQWVDVSDVAPGEYRLAARADPLDVVRESNEADNARAFSTFTSTIPGYVANAVGPFATGYSAPVTVTLAATQFGTPGARRFRIDSDPAHGTLSVAGSPISASAVLPLGVAQVTYQPAAGTTGADSFRFSAIDSTSPYPTGPAASYVANGGAASATATVTVGTRPPTVVGLSGAPPRLRTRATVKLAATVNGIGIGPRVIWSVDPGRGHGVFIADGVYRAPRTVPTPKTVTLRATSADDPAAYAQARVRIVPSPRPKPAPSGGRATFTGPLSNPVVIRRAGKFLVTVRTARKGVVRIAAIRNGARVAGCTVTVPSARSVTCVLGPRAAHPGVRVVATLTGNGQRIARRTTVTP
jgi:Lysyl oxidase